MAEPDDAWPHHCGACAARPATLLSVPAVAHLGMDDATGVRALLPSDAALLVGEAVVYEWAALAYYWGHGWL